MKAIVFAFISVLLFCSLSTAGDKLVAGDYLLSGSMQGSLEGEAFALRKTNQKGVYFFYLGAAKWTATFDGKQLSFADGTVVSMRDNEVIMTVLDDPPMLLTRETVVHRAFFAAVRDYFGPN